MRFYFFDRPASCLCHCLVSVIVLIKLMAIIGTKLLKKCVLLMLFWDYVREININLCSRELKREYVDVVCLLYRIMNNQTPCIELKFIFNLNISQYALVTTSILWFQPTGIILLLTDVSRINNNYAYRSLYLSYAKFQKQAKHMYHKLDWFLYLHL